MTDYLRPLPKSDGEMPTSQEIEQAEERFNLPWTYLLPSGYPELDDIMCFPAHHLSLVYGAQGIGKSNLVLSTAAHAAKGGLKVLYLDTEGALPLEKLISLDLPKNIDVVQEPYVENLFDMVVQSIEEETYDLIIVDSLGSLTFHTEIENDAMARNIGVKALTLNKLFRYVPHHAQKHKTTVICTNHEREGVGAFQKHYLPGGSGQIYAAHHIIRLSRTSKDTFQKNKQIAGHIVTAEVKKSRVTRPYQKTTFRLHYTQEE